MPGVEVTYKATYMNVLAADALKQTVREVGHKRFSTEDIQLTPDDFSFKFLRPHNYDELTHDIIVRIRMQDHPFRRSQSPDLMAGQLANRIHMAMRQSVGMPPFTVGVELVLTEIGWNASSGVIGDGIEG
jgi:hypothetical protein